MPLRVWWELITRNWIFKLALAINKLTSSVLIIHKIAVGIIKVATEVSEVAMRKKMSGLVIVLFDCNHRDVIGDLPLRKKNDVAAMKFFID